MADELNITLNVPKANFSASVLALSGREAISEFFDFTVKFAVEGGDAVPEDVRAGARATLTIEREGELKRTVYGILERLDLCLDAGDGSGRPTYEVRLVPRAWRSRLVRQQRIFMDVSILDVAREKLGKVGVKGDDIATSVIDPHPQREFIVQYQEDDGAFISRLMEHAGVAFYIDHAASKDRIVFVDHTDGFPAAGGDPVPLATQVSEPERFQDLRSSSRMGPGIAMVYDYNYRTPELPLKGMAQVETGHGGGILEYPSHVKTGEDAEALAKIRAEEIAVHQRPFSGRSTITSLAAGQRITFEGTERLPEVPLLITSVEHHGVPGENTVVALHYHNTFTAVRADLPFRPKRVTPRPRITGIITGIVQGATEAKGKRAIIDEHGRYKIAFHFDKVLGSLNEKASRPCRMAQSFTGSSEGMHFPLKPGVEVAVAFIDGDPDRPIVVGALPNHTHTSVITGDSADVNKISTNTGVTISFGKTS